MNVVTLVPRRADGGHRDRLWRFCRDRWVSQHPDWPIFEGVSPEGPFNRSAAVNDAARKAGAWDVAVIIDSDVIANPQAAETAAEIAFATDRLVVSHDDRVMLNKVGTEKVLAGFDGPWRTRQLVETVFTDSVSCCIAVSRKLWGLVGGFDERFVGWNAEDSAFEIACVTFSGKPYVRLSSELFHLHHELAPEARSKSNPLLQANKARLQRYREAFGDVAAVRALLDEPELPATRIPRILHRTVPEQTSEQVEAWWQDFQKLHPGWDLRTYRDPLDPKDWPLTGHLFKRCQNGAQLAGLVRLEALVTHGGAYCDADVQPFRSFEPLLNNPAVVAWEDHKCIPDAVMMCEPNHPAFRLALEKACAAIEGGANAWQSGPGVTTEVMPNRDDVLVLGPSSFFAVHYLEKSRLDEPPAPYEFCRHMWHGSWLSDKQRQSIDKRQRA